MFMKYKVAQIIPYFGKWPEWIELYFYSCGRNPMVDFIFYTDCPLPAHRYKNTLFHQCTYEEYCEMISDRLGIDFHVSKPYKLTDLKPFIGAIHAPELEGYDFWGMGDLDLVYGDLGKILNDQILEQYDVVTTHNYHIAAHCCFCRNNEYYRNLCFQIKEWKEQITDERPMSIDEGLWSDLVCPHIRAIRRIHKYLCKPFGVHYFKVLDALNPILHRRVYLREHWTSPNPSPQKDGKWDSWEYQMKEGKVYDGLHRELPYLHFLFFKLSQWDENKDKWTADSWKLDSDFEKYHEIVFDYKEVKGIK